MFQPGQAVEYTNAVGQVLTGTVLSVTPEQVIARFAIDPSVINHVDLPFTPDGREAEGEPVTLRAAD